MRTTEERLMLIESRKKSIVEQKKKARRAAVNVLSSAACLLLAVFIGVYVSSLGVSSLPDYTVNQTASFIGGGGSAGYVVVGVLCFLLGVCLTMLLYKLRDKGKNGGDK